MKKILISIITILIIILITQLIYFNFNKTNVTNTINETANNDVLDEWLDPEKVNTYFIPEVEITNVIEPKNLDKLSHNYKGDMRLVTLEKELYTFINTNIKTIYNMTNRKSINQILQLYDLNKDTINKMNIYSAEDFEAITTEAFKVANIRNVEYSNSIIDMDSYKEDDNGYCTFNITFIYTNQNEVKIKVYLANKSNLVPNIRFGKQDE